LATFHSEEQVFLGIATKPIAIQEDKMLDYIIV